MYLFSNSQIYFTFYVENITKNTVSREKPIAFNKINDVKKNWENGQDARKEERREERREELQRIRSRLFMVGVSSS